MPDTLQERDLIVKVQAGDLNAFELLMNLHVRRLRAFVALKIPMPHLIEEICHETFVHAFRKIGEFEASGNFGAWLRSIAVYLLRAEIQRYARERRNQEKFLEYALMADAGHRLHRDAALVEHLEDCVNTLPPEMRQLIDLKYRLSLPTEDIARELGRSSAWVRTTLYRLREHLKACLERKWSEVKKR